MEEKRRREQRAVGSVRAGVAVEEVLAGALVVEVLLLLGAEERLGVAVQLRVEYLEPPPAHVDHHLLGVALGARLSSSVPSPNEPGICRRPPLSAHSPGPEPAGPGTGSAPGPRPGPCPKLDAGACADTLKTWGSWRSESGSQPSPDARTSESHVLPAGIVESQLRASFVRAGGRDETTLLSGNIAAPEQLTRVCLPANAAAIGQQQRWIDPTIFFVVLRDLREVTKKFPLMEVCKVLYVFSGVSKQFVGA